MMDREIGLDQWVRARIVDDAGLGNGTVSGTRERSFITPALGPLAGRGRTDHGQAGADRCSLEKGLVKTKEGFHAPTPAEAIETVDLCRVRAVRGKRSVTDLAVGIVRHGRKVERTTVVRRMAA